MSPLLRIIVWSAIALFALFLAAACFASVPVSGQPLVPGVTSDHGLQVWQPDSLFANVPSAAPPPSSFPDTFVYEVRYRWHGHVCPRIRHDVVTTTIYTTAEKPLVVTMDGQQLELANLSPSALARVLTANVVADTMKVCPIDQLTRTEFRRNGHRTSGPRIVHGLAPNVDLFKLMDRHNKYTESLKYPHRRHMPVRHHRHQLDNVPTGHGDIERI